MRLGLIARADNSGLGMQTLEFYRHMRPDKTLVVDISDLNGNKVYRERYPERATFIDGFPNLGTIDEFLQDLDVVFIAESAYNYAFYERAKTLGVKTAVQYNYEFFDWMINPVPLPDMFIAPSVWHFAEVNAWVNHTNQHTGSNMAHRYLHCPVNRQLLPFKEKHQARTFLHVAGRSAAHDRNGTYTIIEASKYITSEAQILIHFQGEQGLPHQATSSIEDYAEYLRLNGNEDRVTIEQIDHENYEDVYDQGDVLLLPRRYGGNCLPLNEALSCGMPVIMTDISPNQHLLHMAHWLVPAIKVGSFTPRTEIDIYEGDARALAERIDYFYSLSEDEMLNESRIANATAEQISWETMEPIYRETLEKLCTQ